MSSSRRPSTAPGPSRDTSLKAPKSSRGSFWSFSSPDKRGSGGSTAPGLNTMAQTHANGPISTSLSLQPSFSDDHERFRPTPTDRSTKSRRTSFFRSSGYVSDDNGGIRGGGHRDKRSELIAQGSAVRVGKTQLQSTPEEAQEVSDLDLRPVPELERARRAQFLRSISSPSSDINTHEEIRSASGGNLQSSPLRSRSGSSSLSRPPPSPSSYAVYTPSVLLPSIAPSNSSSSLASSLSQHGTLAPVGTLSRPERNPERLPQEKTLRRPSTASGVLEGSFARGMMQPLAVPYLHPVKTSTHVRTRLILFSYKYRPSYPLSF